MLKKSILSPFFVVLLMSTIFHIQAQEQWTWNDYNLTFTTPAGFKVEKSTGEEFSGKSDRSKIYLFAIYPVKDENITEENLGEAVQIMASEARMNVQDMQNISFNGFTGKYAEGTIEGVPSFFCCILDPDSDNNFIISIVHNNTDAAIKLMKSIKKIK